MTDSALSNGEALHEVVVSTGVKPLNISVKDRIINIFVVKYYTLYTHTNMHKQMGLFTFRNLSRL